MHTQAAKKGGFHLDPSGTGINVLAAGFPLDSLIVLAKTDIQYANDTIADVSTGVYNHHLGFFDLSKPQTTPYVCGSAAETVNKKGYTIPMSLFLGNAEEMGNTSYSTPDGSFNSGYYLGKKARVMITSELVNYNDQPREIFIVSDIHYVPGMPTGALDTSANIISVTQCDDFANPFLQPPGGKKLFSFTSKPITMTQSGYIIGSRGHLHDGGVNIQLKINDKIICNSQAMYGTNGQTMQSEDGKSWEALSEMSQCTGPWKVNMGDQVFIEANYDLDKHPARKHAHGGMAEEMGLMSFAWARMPPPMKFGA
jgi:Stress up-regulated Nod 19